MDQATDWKSLAKRLEKALEMTHVGFWFATLPDNNIEWSDELYRIYGYAPQEFKPTVEKLMSLIHPDDRKKVQESIDKSLSTHEDGGVECRIVRANGQTRNISVVQIIELGEDGNPARIFGTVQDVTELKKVGEEFSKTNSLLKATLESTADAILVVDTTGKIASFNENFTKLWKIPQEIIDSRDDERALNFVLNQLDDPQQFLNKVKELYSHPEEESLDILLFKDGRVVERYSKPQKIDNVSVGRVWSFRDITKQKHYEQDLLDKQRELEKLVNNMVGREVRMADLKKKITDLTSQLNTQPTPQK